MRYQLKTVAPDGRVELVDFQAADQASAVQQVEERGYTVLSVRAKALIAPWRSAAERFPVVLFSQELRVLLAAGLPLVEAIETLAQKERNAAFRSASSAALRSLVSSWIACSSVASMPMRDAVSALTLFCS